MERCFICYERPGYGPTYEICDKNRIHERSAQIMLEFDIKRKDIHIFDEKSQR